MYSGGGGGRSKFNISANLKSFDMTAGPESGETCEGLLMKEEELNNLKYPHRRFYFPDNDVIGWNLLRPSIFFKSASNLTQRFKQFARNTEKFSFYRNAHA